jgi:hypothetical protein
MAVSTSYMFDTDEDTETRRRRRRQSIADLLMKNADAAPIQSPWQGAAKMASSGISGLLLGMEEKRDREMAESRNAYGAERNAELDRMGGLGQPQQQLSMSPVTQAMMPPEQVKAIIDANVPEEDRAFAYRMAEKESAFNPAAVSPTGAKGLFQFTGGTWGDVTGQAVGRGSDGRADPVANTKAFVELTRRNREALRGVLGRDPTPGELAVAHQQGVGGATALLTGKGTVNPRNLAVQAGNPKNAQDIMRYYGFAPDQGQGGPIQVAQANTGGGTMTDANRLMQIATDRNAPPEIRERAKLMLQSMPKPRDPLEEEAKRLQVERGRLELQKLRNPAAPPPPDAIRKLEAVGIDQPTMQAAIRDPQHPLHKIVSNALGGGVNNSVTVKNEGQIPPGHEAIRDAAGNLTGYRKVPGSPQAEAAENQTAMQKKAANVVVDTITDIEKTISDTRLPTTGFFGNVSAKIPGTPAHNVMANLETVAANISFDKLNEMRKASPTGGALGNVTEKELDLLKASMAALRQSQGGEQFKKNLQRVKDNFLDVIHGPGKRPTDAAAGKENDPMGLR